MYILKSSIIWNKIKTESCLKQNKYITVRFLNFLHNFLFFIIGIDPKYPVFQKSIHIFLLCKAPCGYTSSKVHLFTPVPPSDLVIHSTPYCTRIYPIGSLFLQVSCHRSVRSLDSLPLLSLELGLSRFLSLFLAVPSDGEWKVSEQILQLFYLPPINLKIE